MQPQIINKKLFPLILTFIFFILSFFSLFYHEMWRDELQAWVIARDSHSIFELYNNLRYDGHPVLWYLCLKILQLFTTNPISMQIFHIVLSTLSVFFFVKFSPFNKLQKLFFVFGYFIFYEYTVIARLYTLSFLIITIFCIHYPYRFKRIYLTAFLIFLAFQTNIYTVIIFIVVTFVLILEIIINYNSIKEITKYFLVKSIISLVIIFTGFVISILFIKSAPDQAYLPPAYLKFNLKYFFYILNSITRVFLPLMNFNNNFWFGSGGLGSFFLENFKIYKILQPFISFGLILWAILFFQKKPYSLLIYIGSILGLLLFYYFIFSGFFRHQGFLFLTFILSLWIANFYNEKESIFFKKNNFFINSKFLNISFTILLFVHLIAGITAVSADIKYTFSFGKKAAEFIKRNKLQNCLILGHDDFALTTIIGYVNIKQAFFSQGNRFGSFVKWDIKRKIDVLSDEEMIIKALSFKKEKEQDVLIIVNKPINEDLVKKYSLKLIALFFDKDVVIKEEIYGFYQF